MLTTAGPEVRSDTRRESTAQVPGGAGPGGEEETRRAGAGTVAPGGQESLQERGPRTSQTQGQSQRGKSRLHKGFCLRRVSISLFQHLLES